MIDHMHDLPVARQCQMLSLARSTAYYRAQEVSEADLVLMRRIDAVHLEHPFAGSRMLRDMVRWDGHSIGPHCARSSTIRWMRWYWKPLRGIQARSGAYSAPPAIRANCNASLWNTANTRVRSPRKA